MTRETLRRQAKLLPETPGCYLFYSKFGHVIYVGKAKKLKQRVSSYFLASSLKDERLVKMVPWITELTYQTTASELDALFLEYYLIKKYKPWFNSQMKADKLRPYLRIGREKPYETLTICSEPLADQAAYYDFFTNEEELKAALALFGKVWGLPQCRLTSFAKLQRPCLFYDLGQCAAPCGAKISQTDYQSRLGELTKLLKGRKVKRQTELEQLLHQQISQLAFEQAAATQALLAGLERLRLRSHRRFHLPAKGAALLLIAPYREPAFSAFYVNNGHICNRTDFAVGASTADFMAYSERIVKQPADFPAAQQEWMAACLTEVLLQKTLILLPRGKKEQRIFKALQKFAAR